MTHTLSIAIPGGTMRLFGYEENLDSEDGQAKAIFDLLKARLYPQDFDELGELMKEDMRERLGRRVGRIMTELSKGED
jgi:hypothetical protein